MTQIQQAKLLSQTQYELRGKIASMASELEAQGQPLIKLHLGNPGLFNLHAPRELTDAVQRHSVESQAYCSSMGLPEAREAIQQHWQQNERMKVDLDHILMGNGVSELIKIVLQALLNPGDEILLPMPTYPLWSAATSLCGGVVQYYQCDPSQNWNPDTEHIERLITKKTKAIVVINPNNPTGAVYSKACLEAIADIAARHHLVLFSDEIYSDIIFSPHRFQSMAPLSPDAMTITFRGLSKNYLLAGYRCAWMIVSGRTEHARDYIAGINKLLEMRLCANVPAQYAVPLALSDPKFLLLSLYPEMQDKVRTVTNRLNRIDGLNCHTPQGAFYAYPHWDPAYCDWSDDSQWVYDFLNDHHVLLAPGSTFAQNDPCHFRIALLPDTASLLQACDHLDAFIKNRRR